MIRPKTIHGDHNEAVRGTKPDLTENNLVIVLRLSLEDFEDSVTVLVDGVSCDVDGTRVNVGVGVITVTNTSAITLHT